MHISIVKRCFHCKRKDKESCIVVACLCVVCVLALSKASHCRQEACPFNWVNTHTVPITFINNYVTWCCSKHWWNQLFLTITHHTQISSNINFYVYYVQLYTGLLRGRRTLILTFLRFVWLRKNKQASLLRLIGISFIIVCMDYYSEILKK